jgi:choline dehydrogenase-like flavoprotein
MVMRSEIAQQVSRFAPHDYHRLLPIRPVAGSDQLGWARVEAILVDAELRVDCVEGLRVGDASVMPTIPRRTPTHRPS